jgi:polar amino acid transport system substrate-binding protein
MLQIMNSFSKCLGFTLGFAVAFSAVAGELGLRSRVLTLQVPPYTIESGRNAPGAFSELLSTMAKRFEATPIEIEYFPWARSQMIVQAEPHAVIFPLDRSLERESKFQWIVQLHCRSIGFVALSSFTGDLSHGDKLVDSKVGVLRASPSLKELEALEMKNVIEGRDFADLAKMIQRQVIDVIYGSQDISVYELTEAGVKPSEIKVGQPSSIRGVWLAGNLAMPSTAVHKWRLAFEQVKRDGTYKKILSKYNITERSCP